MMVSFSQRTHVRDLGASCYIINDGTGLYDITNINKSVQGSSGNMSTTKKSKLCMNVHQVDGSKKMHALWPVKYFTKADANLFCLHANSHRGVKFY